MESKYTQSQSKLQDPFQRELIKQFNCLNANLWEIRNNMAIIAAQVQALCPEPNLSFFKKKNLNE